MEGDRMIQQLKHWFCERVGHDMAYASPAAFAWCKRCGKEWGKME